MCVGQHTGSYTDTIDLQRTKLIIHALVIYLFDICNGLLSGLPNNLLPILQQAQNEAARLIMQKSKYDQLHQF